MAEKNAVQCKGCGHAVWVGSKIIDGYCHDCHARGRHLPPIVEDPPYQPQMKQPRPVFAPRPPSPERKPGRAEPRSNAWGDWRVRLRHLPWWKRAFLLLAVTAIICGVAYGIYAWTNSGGSSESEAEEIGLLRAMDAVDFENAGERISTAALAANAEAITTFMSSGASYRMSGSFEYAYYDYADMGQLKKNRTAVSMSYNGDTDVYIFALAGSGDISETPEDLGTYYIVRENGMTYILHEGDGARTVIGIDEGVVVFEFLSQYMMENIVRTDFITATDTTALSYGDGGFYSLPHDYLSDHPPAYGGQHKTELKTYQNRPISWYDCDGDGESAVEWQSVVDFYYDNVPAVVPGVAEWR